MIRIEINGANSAAAAARLGTAPVLSCIVETCATADVAG
jgi:hypothetical protein